MTIEASAMLMLNNAPGGDSRFPYYWIASLQDENLLSLGTSPALGPLPPTSYALESKQWSLTPGAVTGFPTTQSQMDKVRYMSISLFWDFITPEGTNEAPQLIFDVDNIKVEISGIGGQLPGELGGTAQQVPANFLLSVNFEGKQLKSYAVTHELHALEAPTEVVLT